MAGIGKELGFESTFGDWKASSKSYQTAGDADDDNRNRKRSTKLIPDYVLMRESDGEPRVVGEGKTPWKHDFQAWWDDYILGEENSADQFMLTIGKPS